jgi:preprotein translocase SecF subunit
MLLRLVPDKTKFGFMQLHWPALILSMIMVVASVVLVVTRGLNFGIDFVGGTVVEIAEPEGVGAEEIRAALTDLPLGEVQVTEARGIGVDDTPVAVIRIGRLAGEQAEDASQKTADVVIARLKERFGEIDVRRSEGVGAKVSGELLQAGVTALAVALVLMMIYITFRFEWQYGVGAVVALFHDVIITVGVFALLQFEFNLTTIAALLTIIGYSMNDTVVVFDRVREERRRYKKLPLNKVIDLALNATLSRTTLTSGTTLIALFAIFFLGGDVLRGMSFALIWGIVIGTYSSIFVASALILVIGLGRPADEDQSEGQAPATA